ncbi:ABC transporter permease [Streptomyces sp. bgisy100]|uniref:ABC transporter permease n=1 Tax=Streptomyces sp. bgisy100 TaxID=3413783 RepID=UPI003D70FC1D
MTAVAHAPSARALPGRRGGLAGTGTLLRLALRRDRVMMPVWVLAQTAVVAGTGSSLEKLYDTAAKRADVAQSMTTSSSLRGLYGPVFQDTMGGLIAWRSLGFGTVLAALMSLIIVVRHTREEEDTGRQELLSSAVVGRRAPLTAALLAAAVANALLALLVAATASGYGASAAGSLALGLTLGAVGMAFAGVAAVAAQLTEGARPAKGLAGAVLGLAFVLRTAGDVVSDDGSSPFGWASPLGWAENVRPAADERWWILLLLVALTAATTATAFALAGRRDLGAGFLPSRPGPPAGRIGGTYSLALRLQRGSLLGWAAGFAVAGLVFGAITDGAAELVDDNEQTRAIIDRMGGHQGLADSSLAAMTGILGMVAALFAVGSVLRLRSEETAGRAEPVLATAAGRLRWAGSHLAVAFLGTVVVLFACGVAMGVGYGATAGGLGDELPRVLGASLAQVPAVWLAAGCAMLLFGALPRATPVAWGVAGAWLGIGWLGPSVELPQWAMNLSPFSHLPKLPGAQAHAAPFLWLTLLAAALAGAGLLAFRRRDIG